jgi:hypothetical protein
VQQADHGFSVTNSFAFFLSPRPSTSPNTRESTVLIFLVTGLTFHLFFFSGIWGSFFPFLISVEFFFFFFCGPLQDPD